MDTFKRSFLDIFREFGLVGVVTYLGGAIIMIYFPGQAEFNRQMLYAITGLLLLSLATIIFYFRIKAQKEREKLLIEMARDNGNRLAEQIGKGVGKKQIDGILQKIRQFQSNVMNEIYNHSIEK